MQNIQHFSKFDSTIQKLLETSIKARENAYVPYSKFKVGAAIFCEDGTIFTGSNIENCSYSLTTCAERTGIVKAVSEGYVNFKHIAICAMYVDYPEKFVAPCGSCRQIISEFNEKHSDINIFLIKPDKSDVLCTSIKTLLPLNFYF